MDGFSMWPVVWLAVFLAVAISTSAVAAPSFDCERADSTLDVIICRDGVVADLDSRLSDAYSKKAKAESEADSKRLLLAQRQWLKRRYSECDAPRGNSAPTIDQQWAVAPCLANLYQKRLADLGVELPRSATELAKSSGVSFIHPSCLFLVVGVGFFAKQAEYPPMKEVPIEACNRGHAHWPLRTNGRFISSSGSEEGDFSEEFGYWFAGKLEDGRDLAVVYYSGGGTGFFTTVVAITRTKRSGRDWMSAEAITSGGDRAGGGVLDAKPTDGGAVVSIEVTPYAVLKQIGAKFNWQEVTGCAHCRVGSADLLIDLRKKTEILLSITVDGIDGLKKNPHGKGDICFVSAVDASGGQYPHVYKDAQLLSLKDAFGKCMQEAARSAPD